MMKMLSNGIIGTVAYLLVLIVGLTFFGWRWQEILLLYWLENISVGAVNVVRMIRAPKDDQIKLWLKIPIIIFFIIHYGLFTLVHGGFVMVMILISFAWSQANFNTASFARSQLDSNLVFILLTWAVMLITQVIVSIFDKAPNATLVQLFHEPYKRVMLLHFTILLGTIIVIPFGFSSAPGYLFVAIHAFVALKQQRQNREQVAVEQKPNAP